MTEIACPVCKISTYLNPDIKIYISPCYHILCESCLLRIFAHLQAPCPECGTILRKINYISQTFEDMTVEKECKIRKQLMRYYYKEEHDFETIIEYNDYLEDFENTVFELLEMEENARQLKLLEIRKKYVEPRRQKHKQEFVEDQKRFKPVVYDPLSDISIPQIFITKKHHMPLKYKKTCLATGFNESVFVYKAYISLADEDI